jgi:putative transcriptional regulator
VTGAKADPVYLGGPVELSSAQALLRSPSKSDDLVQVLGSVYATANKDIIEKSISTGAEPSRFHLYLGYAGWAAGQLEEEMELGAWSVLRTTPDEIFDEDPDSLWTRLSRKADSQIAFTPRPNGGMIPSSH